MHFQLVRVRVREKTEKTDRHNRQQKNHIAHIYGRDTLGDTLSLQTPPRCERGASWASMSILDPTVDITTHYTLPMSSEIAQYLQVCPPCAHTHMRHAARKCVADRANNCSAWHARNTNGSAEPLSTRATPAPSPRPPWPRLSARAPRVRSSGPPSHASLPLPPRPLRTPPSRPRR